MSNKRGNNEGSIYQSKDGRWRAAASVGFANGKPIRKVLSAQTRHDASRKLTAFMRQQELGGPVPNDQLTVGSYLTRWIETTVSTSVRPTTLRSYEQMVRNHIVKTLNPEEIEQKRLDQIQGLASVPINKLSAQQLNEFYAAKIKAGNSPSIVRYLRTVLRIALNEAIRQGIIVRNAAALSKSPRVPDSSTPGFAPDEAQRLLAAVQGHHLEALFTVALAVGLRHGEALALYEKDVDFEVATLRVHYTLQRIDGKLVRVETKSKAGKRIVPLPTVCLGILSRWLDMKSQYRLLAGSRWTNTEFLFTSTVGTPLLERNVLRSFYSLLNAAKLPRRRIHDLRHACVSLLGAEGVDLKTISEIVGHSDIRLTQNIYQHAFLETKRQAASKMNVILQRVATRVATKAGEGLADYIASA